MTFQRPTMTEWDIACSRSGIRSYRRRLARLRRNQRRDVVRLVLYLVLLVAVFTTFLTLYFTGVIR